jgi:hypothetical protein
MNRKMEKLVKKWAKVLEGLSTESEVKVMAQLLENESVYFDKIVYGDDFLTEGDLSASEPAGGFSNDGNVQTAAANTAGDPSTFRGIGRYKRIAIPLVRRVFPELLANQLVGVQPMQGPVGLAYALRFRNSLDNSELGYNLPTNMSGVYGDANYNTLPGMSGERMNEAIGNYQLGAAGLAMAEVGLSIEQKEVKARTRKLKARWTIEAQQDLAAMQNVDLEQEMMDLLSYEIAAEIDRELVARIHNAAEQGGYMTWTYGTSGNVSGTADGRWEMEKFKTLWTSILYAAEDINRATRVGAGNYVIVSPRVCAALQQLPGFTIAPVASTVNALSTGVSLVGELNGLRVYRDTFAYQQAGLWTAGGMSIDTNGNGGDFCVIGYKGQRENDTGIIYCPYIPVMFAKATGEESFSPRAGVMTRYGVVDHLFGSQNYYRKIFVADLYKQGSFGSFIKTVSRNNYYNSGPYSVGVGSDLS